VPTEDFWPSDLDKIELRTPLSILKEQASVLGAKTANAVIAEVTSKSEAGLFYHRLFLVVPVLDNYRYQLLTVNNGVKLYPLELKWAGRSYRCLDEADFKERLKETLSSDETRILLAALVAQAKADGS
jgi:hypothetical protein